MIANSPPIPRPYQQAAIAWLERRKGRGILADPPGAGKTIEALGWAMAHPQARPGVVVCPVAVKEKWRWEIERYGEKAIVLSGRNGDIPEGYPWIVLNWDILKDRVEQLQALKPAILILDEAHYAKDRRAQRTRAAIKLARSTPYVLCLSGSPLINTPLDLWPLLHMVDSYRWRSWWHFAYRYCAPEEIQVPTKYGRRWVWRFRGASNVEELRQLAGPYILRREMPELLPELPSLERIPLPLGEAQELSPKSLHLAPQKVETLRQIWEEVKGLSKEDVSLLLSHRPSFRLALHETMEELRQRAGLLKVPHTVELVSLLLASPGEQVAIYAHHHQVVDALVEALSPSYELVLLTGRQDEKERNLGVKAFQEGKVPIAIVSPRAMGVGIDLQSARFGIWHQLDWSPSLTIQAEGRLWRMGQRRGVVIYYPYYKHSIEESMMGVLQYKAWMQAAILDDSLKEATLFASAALEMLRRLFGGEE